MSSFPCKPFCNHHNNKVKYICSWKRPSYIWKILWIDKSLNSPYFFKIPMMKHLFQVRRLSWQVFYLDLSHCSYLGFFLVLNYYKKCAKKVLDYKNKIKNPIF